MDALYFVCWTFSISITSATYNIDKVYEMQPGNKPFMIYSENYPSNYPVGKKYRYQITGPSYYKVKAICSVNIEYNGYVCSPDDIFMYLEDGTTNLYSDHSISGCGHFDQISIVSRFNSITFGMISKKFSGNVSCEISINPYAEPCDCGWHINTKIYNGAHVSKNSLASMAALHSGITKSVFCGATLISENFLLTAAHCVVSLPMNEIKKMWVLIGRDNVQISDPNNDTPYAYNYKIAWVKAHEQYNSQTYINDIGLVKTIRRIALSQGVAPACLPKKHESVNKYIGKAVTYAGWGFTEPVGHPSPILLATSVTVYPIDRCKRDLNDNSITSNQTCTVGFGHDACQVDSGGPALYYDTSIYRYFVYGISSFGPLCGVNQPAVCTLVSAYRDWIELKARPLQSFCLS